MRGVRFLYDLASAEAYLAAEQVMTALPVVPEWTPIHLAAIPDAAPIAADRATRAELEQRAAELGLQQLRWPGGWPSDGELAMLAATYSKSIGRAVAFSLAAFRQAFAAGRDLSQPDWVAVAGAACEMHPNALLKALEMRSVRQTLATETASAAALGVRQVPAITIGDHVVQGRDAVELAAAALAAEPAS